MGLPIPRVLLVEDVPAQRQLTLEAVERCEDYANVDACADGEAALAYLASTEPDMILLDFDLPGIDGREVLRRIKGTPGLCHIPVVVMSDAEDVVEAAMRGRANAFADKPADAGALDRLLQHLARWWLGVVEVPREMRALHAMR